ncbi:MAG: hypothetical protein R6U30_16195 [Halomonas sp.]|uniref:hypothetical protein n=1 Tax=Halomonas sp. TaxID=1486246 RepID=UPI003970DC44
MSRSASSTSNRHLAHLSIVERGKLAAIAGNHDMALECYRTGLRMAQSLSAPGPFARHYTDCILDSLERAGRLEPALSLCESASRELSEIPSPNPLQRRDHATLLLRQALLLLRLGREKDADLRLAESIALARPGRLPLAEEIQGWRARALTLTPERLDEAQARHGYYTVRRDTLRPDLARISETRVDHCAFSRHHEVTPPRS